MMELLVDLDFACCKCKACVGVKLKCEGKGLEEVMHTVAAVNVPCPECGSINELCFEPNGTIRAVRPYRGYWTVPGPSRN
jgi:hypothetical protein